MSVLAMVGLELRQWGKVYAVAAGLGVLLAVTPWVPGVVGPPDLYARWTAAGVAAFALAIGVALVRGATMVGGELWLKRAGFFFARPLSATTIWAGKYLGTLALAWGSAALAVLPVILVALTTGRAKDLEWGLVPLLAFTTVGALAAAHVAGVALASQSRLVLVELIALPLVAWLWFRLMEGVLRWGGPEVVGWTVMVTVVALVLLLLAAGWAQMAYGRCDAVRGHRRQALVLWSGVGVLLAALAGWQVFLAGATPSSLRLVKGAYPGPSSWLLVWGHSRWDVENTFILNARTGSWISLGPGQAWQDYMAFAADGSRAAWLAPQFTWGALSWQLSLVDLDVPSPRVRSIPIVFSREEGPRRLALSPEGSRLLLVEGTSAVVYECDRWTKVASLGLPSPHVVMVRLAAADRAQLMVFKPDAIERAERARDRILGEWEGAGDLILGEWHLASGRWLETGRIRAEMGEIFWARCDASCTRLLLYRPGRRESEVRLLDARNGAQLATLGRWPGDEIGGGLFSVDGRVVLGVCDGGEGLVRVFSAEGQPLATFNFGTGLRPRPAAEPVEGQVLVALFKAKQVGPPEFVKTLLVDLETGAQRALPEGYQPFSLMPWLHGVEASPVPGSLAALLLSSPKGGLALLDPVNAEATPLLGKP